jgi:hypothetical protein
LDGTRALTDHCFHLAFDDGFREMHDDVGLILRPYVQWGRSEISRSLALALSVGIGASGTPRVSSPQLSTSPP